MNGGRKARPGWHYLAGAVILGGLCLPVLATLVRGEAAVPVETEAVAYHPVRTSVLASGRLLYEEQVLLSPEVIGRVGAILVREGQQVRKGELLMRLDDHEYRAAVAQQEAAVRQQRIAIAQQQLGLRNQRQQYERKMQLHGMKMIADAQIDEARFAVEGAELELRNSRSRLEEATAVLRQAAERLARTDIRAPIAGTVIALDIKVGETAVASQVGIAGSTLMAIANTATMLAEVNVDEADIAHVRQGQQVELHAAALPDQAIAGKVLAIPLSPRQAAQGQGGAAQARAYAVKVALAAAPPPALRPGMSCRAEIFTAAAGTSLAVPLQAILSNNDEEMPDGRAGKDRARRAVKPRYHVFVHRDGRAEQRVVEVGLADDSRQQVVRGVALGESVITGPYRVLRQLQAGDAVQIASAAIGARP